MPMAFVRCYLDGSEDTDATIFGVGGFVGDAEEWERIQPLWLATLPPGIDYFHATDCFTGNGQFKGIDIPQRVKLLDTLVDLVISRNLKLICHGIDEAAYHRYASPKSKIHPFGQNKYGSCFGSAIEYACESMGPRQMQVEHGCAFVVEIDEYEATAKREFTQLRTVPAIWFRDRIGTDTYGTKKGKDKIPLLQVADLGVFLGLKALSRCKPGKIDWRPYYRKLKTTDHVFCCRKDGKRKLKIMHATLQKLKHGRGYRIPLN
jgi:hypothetical protein